MPADDPLPTAALRGSAWRRLLAHALARPDRVDSAAAWSIGFGASIAFVHLIWFVLMVLLGGVELTGPYVGILIAPALLIVTAVWLGAQWGVTVVLALGMSLLSRPLARLPRVAGALLGAALTAAGVLALEPVGAMVYRGIATDWAEQLVYVLTGAVGATWGLWLPRLPRTGPARGR